MANIKVNLPAAPFSGQIVTFAAPCSCADVSDGLSINGEIYTVVDAMGKCVTGVGGAWCSGAQISVILDCENKKAYIQNNSNYAPAGYGQGTKQDGEKDYFPRTGEASGWYRIAIGDITLSSAIVTVHHSWSKGGSSDMALMVSCLSPIKCLKCDGATTENQSLISNARLVKTEDNRYALDVFYRRVALNDWSINIINTGCATGEMARFRLQTPTFIAADDTLPDGESLFQPMEWQNPPMLLGVEYRTTERYLGKPVYVKAVDCGALPNSSEKEYSFGISGIDSIIDYSVVSSSGDPLPSKNIQTSPQQIIDVNLVTDYNGGQIRVQTNFDASSCTFRVKLKYTKTTD